MTLGSRGGSCHRSVSRGAWGHVVRWAPLSPGALATCGGSDTTRQVTTRTTNTHCMTQKRSPPAARPISCRQFGPSRQGKQHDGVFWEIAALFPCQEFVSDTARRSRIRETHSSRSASRFAGLYRLQTTANVTSCDAMAAPPPPAPSLSGAVTVRGRDPDSASRETARASRDDPRVRRRHIRHRPRRRDREGDKPSMAHRLYPARPGSGTPDSIDSSRPQRLFLLYRGCPHVKPRRATGRRHIYPQDGHPVAVRALPLP